MARLRPALFAVALLISSSAVATVVLALSMEELSARAPLIVHAVAQGSNVAWDEPHAKIWTWTELCVKETLKAPSTSLGLNGGTLVVKQPGGVVGEVGMEIAGVATFKPGEEVVLFLEPAPDEPGIWVPVSMSASKVTLEERFGTRVAKRDLGGLAFARVGEQRVVEPRQEREILGTADAFLARIKAAVTR